jgi:hypothetical protein
MSIHMPPSNAARMMSLDRGLNRAFQQPNNQGLGQLLSQLNQMTSGQGATATPNDTAALLKQLQSALQQSQQQTSGNSQTTAGIQGALDQIAQLLKQQQAQTTKGTGYPQNDTYTAAKASKVAATPAKAVDPTTQASQTTKTADAIKTADATKADKSTDASSSTDSTKAAKAADSTTATTADAKSTADTSSQSAGGSSSGDSDA